MEERERLKRELINLIDLNKDAWVKAAFFSDDVVEKLMEVLYARWENSDEAGIPIDYASVEELKVLLELAHKYARMSSRDAMNLVIKRIYSEE